MPKELVCLAPRKVSFREYAERELGKGEIRLHTLCSGISHGTEMAFYRGTNPYLHKRHEDALFKDGEPLVKYPRTLGYEEVAEVVEVGEGVSGFRVGDIVAAAYGHRETAIVNAGMQPYLNLIPQDVDPEKGIFQALGGVALDAVLTSGIKIGESAAVFGQGVIGLLVVQLCRIAGAEPVIALDLLDSRLSLAQKVGADYTVNPSSVDDVAVEVRKYTRTRGVDVSFEVSGSYKALHEAIRCGATYYSKVIAVAFYQGPGTALYLGEEFHHSQHLIGGAKEILVPNHRLPAAPGRQWDRNRVVRTVLDLIFRGRLAVDGLISHRFSFSDAAQAFELIDQHPERCTKVILEFA
jgi:2-desacetyl-2-hydroxyethyl bacteriochlorophyllide A dehydrogenase